MMPIKIKVKKINLCICSPLHILLFLVVLLLPSFSVRCTKSPSTTQLTNSTTEKTSTEKNGNGNGDGEDPTYFTVDKIYLDCYTKNKVSAGLNVWGCVGVGDDDCIRHKNCHFVLAYKRIYHPDLTHKTSFQFRLLDDATVKCGEENGDSKCSNSRHFVNNPDRYVAVGFSGSGKMGRDLVVSCISFRSKLDIALSYNFNRQKGGREEERGNRRLEKSMIEIDPEFPSLKKNRVTGENGQLLCSFDLDASITLKNDTFTGKHLWDQITFDFIKESYYILISSGRATGARELSYHLKSRYWMEENVDFSRVQTYIIPFDRGPAILASKIHIVLMVMAYVIFIPSATLVARFYKESRQKSRCCFRRIWFMFHMIMMTIGALCVIFGNFLIGVFIGTFKKMYYKGDRPPVQTVKFRAHYFVGLFATASFVVNVILGAYLSLSHLDRGLTRIVIKFIHWIISVSSYMLGISQIFLVPYLIPDHVDWCTAPSIVVLVWVVLHMSVYLYLTMILYKRDKYFDDMERRSKEQMKVDFLVEFRKLKRANAERHKLHQLQKQQHEHKPEIQNPHQNPHENQHKTSHANPHQAPHTNLHQNPHENPHQNPHENPHTNPHQNPHQNPHENLHQNPHQNPHENLHQNPHENTHKNSQEDQHENPHRDSNESQHQNPHGSPHQAPHTNQHQNPHENPHNNSQEDQHENPHRNSNESQHQKPHKNLHPAPHEIPPSNRRQSGQRLLKVKENLYGSETERDALVSTETPKKMSLPSPPTSLQDHFAVRKSSVPGLGQIPGQGREGSRSSRSNVGHKKKTSTIFRNSRSSFTVNPAGLTSPRKNSLKNKALGRIRWSQVNPLQTGGFEITRRKLSFSTFLKTQQLSPIKPNPATLTMRRRSSLTKKRLFSNKTNTNKNTDSFINKDKDEGENDPNEEFSESPDPYLDVESIEEDFQKQNKDKNQVEDEDEEVEVVRILHQNRKKTDPFLEIDQFEVHQAAVRYEEKHDVKRAFRSYPLDMNFFIENPHTKQLEVILIVFFIVAVITSCVLCYTLFPPSDQRRGQCEDENGDALWMNII